MIVKNTKKKITRFWE